MDLPYEKAVAELETVVDKLSAGSSSLDEMMALYERGTVLVRHCESLLDAYEKRLDKAEAPA